MLVVGFNLGAAADQPAISQKIDLTVTDVTGLDVHRPVTGGVPLAEGAAVAGSQFLLTNDQGEQVPCQTSIMAQWNDGSARWILLDFQAAPPPNGTARFALSWGDQLKMLAPRQPVYSPERSKRMIQSGSIQLSPATDGLLDIGDRLSIRMTLIDDQGQHCGASHGRVNSRWLDRYEARCSCVELFFAPTDRACWASSFAPRSLPDPPPCVWNLTCWSIPMRVSYSRFAGYRWK